MVDAYRQQSPTSPPVLIGSGRVVAYGDEEAIREAGIFEVQFNPTYIVVRHVARKGADRIVHKSEPVFR
jgi:hypothetical protein